MSLSLAFQQYLEGLRVYQLHLSGDINGDGLGLEVFRTHHGPCPPSPSGTPGTEDSGIADQLFPSWPNTDSPGALSMYLLQPLLSLGGVLPPQLPSIPNFIVTVIYIKV